MDPTDLIPFESGEFEPELGGKGVLNRKYFARGPRKLSEAVAELGKLDVFSVRLLLLLLLLLLTRARRPILGWRLAGWLVDWLID